MCDKCFITYACASGMPLPAPFRKMNSIRNALSAQVDRALEGRERRGVIQILQTFLGSKKFLAASIGKRSFVCRQIADIPMPPKRKSEWKAP